MPQTALSVPGLTAHELVTYTTWMRGCSWTEARRRATQALDAVELSARARSMVCWGGSGGWWTEAASNGCDIYLRQA